jgi:protein required for attachment to host cells
MGALVIPHDALVFVGDGQKALFLRNANGVSLFGQRCTDHDQGTDRPGRVFKRAGTNLRSGVEGTDWHELEKAHFAARVAAALEQFVRTNNTRKIIIVAPPRTLAELRRVFHPDVRNRVAAEIDKDLTKEPIWSIERHLFRRA